MPPETPPHDSSETTAEELRRRAFGPGSNEAERAAATRQLRQRESVEPRPQLTDSAETYSEVAPDAADSAAAGAVPPALESHEVRSTEGPAGPDATTALASPAPVRRRIAAVWILPLVGVSLAVGAVVGSALTPSFSSVTAPSDTPSSAQPTFADIGPDQRDGSVGNLQAARARLSRAATASDTFPLPGLIDAQNVSSVRLIKSITDENATVTVWGARDSNDGICLLVILPGDLVASQCVLPKSFSERGISSGANGYEVSWDGVEVSFVLPVISPSY